MRNTLKSEEADRSPSEFVSTVLAAFDIILLNYKAPDKLLRCVASIRKHTRERYRVTVVDNENSETSRRTLSSLKDVQTLFPEKNLGVSGGTNAALRKTDGEFVVFLDDDAVVSADWLRRLHRAIQDRPDAAIAGCKVRFPDRRIMSAEYLPDALKPIGYGEMDRGQRNYARDCDAVLRTCLLMRRRLWREIGDFDERFFPAQYETIDYCLRARLAGWKILYVGSVCVEHDHLFRGADFFDRMEKLFLEKWGDRFADFPLRDSHPADCRLTEGFRHFREGRFAEAAVSFEAAEALDPRFRQPFEKGEALFRCGRYPEAIRSFRRALADAPSDIVSRHRLAVLYERTGCWRLMRKEADRVLAYLQANQNRSLRRRGAGGGSAGRIEIDLSRRSVAYHLP